MASKTIKKHLVQCMIALAAVSFIQFAVSSGLRFQLDANLKEQRAMANVQVQQMFGDMKHDAIQNDVFRLLEAARLEDSARIHEERANLQSDVKALQDTYEGIRARNSDPGLRAMLDAQAGPRNAYAQQAEATAAAIVSRSPRADAEMAKFTRAFEALERANDGLGENISRNIEERNAAADRNTTIALILDLCAVLALGAVIVYTGRTILRRVIRPIEALSSALRRMADGDYKSALPSLSQGDEIAQIGDAALVFQKAALAKLDAEQNQALVVAQLSTGLQKLADKDLEFRIAEPFPPEYEALRGNYNSAVASLAQTVAAVRVGAVGVMTSMTEIRAASDDLSSRNEQQAAGFDALHLEAAQGEKVVAQAADAMRELEETSAGIAQITNLIDSIAFQTNLLALNAGVEAARAGDAGKGFTVVANEVRALSQRTSDAAHEIKALIERSSGQVETGVSHVQGAAQMLGRIVQQLTAFNSTIQQNAAMAEQTTASTRSVASEAQRLGELVQTFRTRNVDHRPASTPIAGQLRRHSIREAPARTLPAPTSTAPKSMASNVKAADTASSTWTGF